MRSRSWRRFSSGRQNLVAASKSANFRKLPSSRPVCLHCDWITTFAVYPQPCARLRLSSELNEVSRCSPAMGATSVVERSTQPSKSVYHMYSSVADRPLFSCVALSSKRVPIRLLIGATPPAAASSLSQNDDSCRTVEAGLYHNWSMDAVFRQYMTGRHGSHTALEAFCSLNLHSTLRRELSKSRLWSTNFGHETI